MLLLVCFLFLFLDPQVTSKVLLIVYLPVVILIDLHACWLMIFKMPSLAPVLSRTECSIFLIKFFHACQVLHVKSSKFSFLSAIFQSAWNVCFSVVIPRYCEFLRLLLVRVIICDNVIGIH